MMLCLGYPSIPKQKTTHMITVKISGLLNGHGILFGTILGTIPSYHGDPM